MLVAHTDSVVSVTDMGGGKIASASKDGSLRVWDLEQQRCLAVADKAHEGKAVEAVCSLPGNRLCSGGDDNALRMWRWRVMTPFHPSPLSPQVSLRPPCVCGLAQIDVYQRLPIRSLKPRASFSAGTGSASCATQLRFTATAAPSVLWRPSRTTGGRSSPRPGMARSGSGIRARERGCAAGTPPWCSRRSPTTAGSRLSLWCGGERRSSAACARRLLRWGGSADISSTNQRPRRPAAGRHGRRRGGRCCVGKEPVQAALTAGR